MNSTARYLTWGVCVGLFGPAVAVAEVGDSVEYVLNETSDYVEGCYGACLCPLFLAEDFSGSFRLTEVEPGNDPPQRNFIVSDVVWFVGGLDLQATGSGTYTLVDPGGEDAAQELVLDLLIDGEPAQFDSGLVPGGGFPDIAIDVNRFNFECFDQVFMIDASPAGMGDLNADGSVNGADLAMMLGQWGACGGCASDLNQDAHVDAADLAMLLGNWTAD